MDAGEEFQGGSNQMVGISNNTGVSSIMWLTKGQEGLWGREAQLENKSFIKGQRAA